MTSEALPDAGTVYASTLRRTGAMIVDCLIEVVFCLGLVKLAGLRGLAYNVVSQICSMAYFVAFESSAWRATPGKRLLGIYMADREGNRISPLRALARFIVLYAPGLPLLFVTSSQGFTGFDARVQEVKHLSADQQPAAMAKLFHENSAVIGQFLIILAGSCILSIALYWLPIIFTKQKTGLHDIVTNVRVLRKAAK